MNDNGRVRTSNLLIHLYRSFLSSPSPSNDVRVRWSSLPSVLPGSHVPPPLSQNVHIARQ